MINSWADIFKIVDTAYFKTQQLAKQTQKPQENSNVRKIRTIQINNFFKKESENDKRRNTTL
jgi:hypothetical protein